jgi:predicted permease
LRSPASDPSTGAIGIVAAGVGLAAMVFALADPVFRGLPYADPDQLVLIRFGLPKPGMTPNPNQVPTLSSWQARTDLFEGVAAFLDTGWLRVRLADRILPLRSVAASDNLLEVLGVPSRLIDADVGAAWLSNRAVTLSAGDLSVGRSMPLLPEGVLRVSGLLPRSFLLPEANRTEPVDALVLLRDGPVVRIEGMRSQALDLVARMRHGVTRHAVEAALNVSMAPIGRPVSVVPLSTTLNARLLGLAKGALLASGFILLVCWANVFSTALTRGLYRATELATRSALGATTSHIARLLGGETLKVMALGGGGALAVTWLALRAAVPVFPPQFATLGSPSITGRVVLFVLVGVSIGGVSWYLASLVAWRLRARRHGLQVVSRDGGTLRTLRFALVAGQLAATSVLLVGSALLARSYLNLLSVDAGLDDRTQTLTVVHDPELPQALKLDLVKRTVMALRTAGGVEAVGAGGGSLLDGRGNPRLLIRNGRPTLVDWTYVAGEYFAASGLQFLAGGPPAFDDAGAAVITERAARALFGKRDPVGQVLSYGRDFRVVGVVRDVRARGLSLEPTPGIYSRIEGWPNATTTYFLRASGDSVRPASWQRIVRGVDPMAVILDGGSVRERLNRSVRDRTFAAVVLGLFALAGVLIATLGVAGVVAYTVVRRTRELAIRLALGATVPDVAMLVARDALAAATCGVAAGVAASVWLSRGLESLLYGIPAAEPMTLLLTAAGLLGAAGAAATLPGVRAARIDPASALRVD